MLKGLRSTWLSSGVTVQEYSTHDVIVLLMPTKTPMGSMVMAARGTIDSLYHL